jgi:hypothetical protein
LNLDDRDGVRPAKLRRRGEEGEHTPRQAGGSETGTDLKFVPKSA